MRKVAARATRLAQLRRSLRAPVFARRSRSQSAGARAFRDGNRQATPRDAPAQQSLLAVLASACGCFASLGTCPRRARGWRPPLSMVATPCAMALPRTPGKARPRSPRAPRRQSNVVSTPHLGRPRKVRHRCSSPQLGCPQKIRDMRSRKCRQAPSARLPWTATRSMQLQCHNVTISTSEIGTLRARCRGGQPSRSAASAHRAD